MSEQEENVTEEVITREDEANQQVWYYTKWSIGAGAIPIPLADLAAITGIQMQMLSKLSDLYEVPFSENRVKSIVASLIGGFLPTRFGWSAGYALGSMVKGFPVVGAFIGIGTVSVFAGASTYAVGKVFTRHFEQGGTLLNLDAEKTKEFFREQYEKGASAVKGSRSTRKARSKKPGDDDVIDVTPEPA